MTDRQPVPGVYGPGQGKELWRRVVRLHRAHPDWGATRIAYDLGVTDGYVRATARRHGLSLPRSEYGAVPSHGAKYRRSLTRERS